MCVISPTIDRTNVSSDGAATELQLQVAVIVSFRDPRTDVTVPLGASDQHGHWTSLDLDASAVLDRSAREDLVEWLASGESAGLRFDEDVRFPAEAVGETLQRCLLLSELKNSKL